jgi:D-3-phosphoglycerate dehydrogenase
MYHIVITDERHGRVTEEQKVLQEIGCTPKVCNFTSDEEALPVLKEADGIIVNLFPMTGTLIEQLQRCKVISRYGVGYDNVDVEAATRSGIQVTRVPDYCCDEVCEHALALLLGLVRKIPFKDRLIRQGKWNLHKEQRCYRMQGKVLGIVGFGSIGSTLCQRSRSLGFSRILVYDPYVEKQVIEREGAAKCDFDTLVRESDYVSLHVPLNNETRGMISADVLSRMKPGGLLVNTSRGPIVEEPALVEALKTGEIAGAGLDVYEQEPLSRDSELRRLDNVVLTDHTAFYSEESVADLKTQAARNVVEILQGKPPSYPVNKL